MSQPAVSVEGVALQRTVGFEGVAVVAIAIAALLARHARACSQQNGQCGTRQSESFELEFGYPVGEAIGT